MGLDCPRPDCGSGLNKQGQEVRQYPEWAPHWYLYVCPRCMTWWLLLYGEMHEVSKEAATASNLTPYLNGAKPKER